MRMGQGEGRERELERGDREVGHQARFGGGDPAQLAESMGYYRGIGDAVGRAAGTP